MIFSGFKSMCDARVCSNMENDQEAPSEEAIQRSCGLNCCICFEEVVNKEDPEERFFGIQSHCDHICCWDCISRWRKESGKKRCPLCRESSDSIVKSRIYMDSFKFFLEKLDLLERHRVCCHSNEVRRHRAPSSRRTRIYRWPLPASQRDREERTAARRQQRRDTEATGSISERQQVVNDRQLERQAGAR